MSSESFSENSFEAARGESGPVAADLLSSITSRCSLVYGMGCVAVDGSWVIDDLRALGEADRKCGDAEVGCRPAWSRRARS